MTEQAPHERLRTRPSVLRMLLIAICVSLWLSATAMADDHAPLPALDEIQVPSSIDGSLQPSMIWLPTISANEKRPLFIVLHTWSGDYRQKNDDWFREAVDRRWIYLHPNFRGPNDRPQACGSPLARQDILDAIDHVVTSDPVDVSRIYLAGASGGGHMTMLMTAYHPRRFSAASAWVGISDLAEWYRFHTRDGQEGGYAKMVRASCEGVPGESASVDAEYRARSPIHHLHDIGDLPLELSAGVEDGHVGSVPIQHTLRAFNVVAKAGGFATISDDEIDQLWQQQRLEHPQSTDRVTDPTYGREIRLRRYAGPARVTIFDGNHEGLPHAATQWLATHKRQTKSATEKTRR